MGRNSMDDDAPASNMVRALDGPERGARRGEPPPAEDGVGPRRSSGHRASPHPASPRRVGRPTRLTPGLANALVKLIAQTG